MANKQFTFKFSFRNNDGALYLRIGLSGHQPAYSKVENLVSPNWNSWNGKLFNEPTDEAIHNNKVLNEKKEQYRLVCDTCKPSTPQELKQLYFKTEKVGANIEEKREPTFGEYLKQLIEDMKSGKDNRKPSKNYQIYRNLLHKLEQEGNIIDVPLPEIKNKHFIAFGDFILTLPKDKGRMNYKNIMMYFKAVHNKALKKELNKNVLLYDYAEYAPKREPKERGALKERQYKKFVAMNLSGIFQNKRGSDIDTELLRNFCIFMYEMKMRPADIIRLHSKNIVIHDGKEHVRYLPEKKKNKTFKKAMNEITPTAQSIIDKYAGKSSKGYVFPFAMNEIDWNYEDAESWNQWQNQRQYVLAKINEFLKSIAIKLKIDPTDFTTYTFRHSAFTHEVKNNKKDLLSIATEGGTSVEMLQKHYVQYVPTL